eukprot:TRINITY_DN877_c0_g1_i1.p1 TRINITY_DN877_c0_g1~~TRINITY_DN877_c0_g1_i1.p1  ORF type:complete len:277 (-),score=53.44 TRINITY_DN877_c0_g1_i1:318-1148(-)
MKTVMFGVQLPSDISKFDWVSGVTPLSSWEYPAVVCILYFVIIYGIQYLMRDRKPFDLKWVIACHNLILSIGSFAYVLYMFYEAYKMMAVGGVSGVLCDADLKYQTGSYYFGLYLFYLSKYYELLDTLFLVLKKKPLIFLHVYHHPATLVLCWVCLEWRVAPQWHCTTANAIVHTFMYYYYFLATLGKTVFWKKYITKLQITQFVVDVGLNFVWVYYTSKLESGKTCGGGWLGWAFGQFILGSYLLLFIQFYIQSYKSAQANRRLAKKVVDGPKEE